MTITITRVSIVVPGEPVAKARARTVRTKSGASRTFTPRRTAYYESQVKACAQVSMRGREIIEGPVELELDVYRPIPASWPKARRVAADLGTLRPTSRPDVSNVIKSIEDGLNGVVWFDDAQIVGLHARSWYSDVPRVVATVTALHAQGGSK